MNADEHLTQPKPADRPPTRRDRSAGGVAYRHHPKTGAIEIALIATRNGQRWQLPKGALEKGETVLQAAQREVWEEVGLETVNEGFIREIDYWYWDTYRKSPPERVHKSVAFFLLRMVGGALSDTSFEVDAVGWFTPAEAEAKLSFSGELAVVKEALARIASAPGPGATQDIPAGSNAIDASGAPDSPAHSPNGARLTGNSAKKSG